MDTPRLDPELERRREEIVEQLDKRPIREDAALRYVAQSVATISDVPMAHVSLMETEAQCVVGHVGMQMNSYERDQTFCAYTIADEKVTIVEDAEDDPRFCDNPFVVGEPGVSFYVGLPLLVDDTPVGTLCAIDTEPKTLDIARRSELFGLVNAVESHLEVIYRHGVESPDHAVSSKLTAIRALAAKERFRHRIGEVDDELRDSLRQLEAEASKAYEVLAERLTIEEIGLGVADTDVELVEDDQAVGGSWK